MNKNSKQIPKDNDILVLEKNRNIIYSYNAKGKSFNAFNIAVCVMSKGKYDVIYSKDNDDVTAYEAPYDFATQEEIEKFNDAISKGDGDVDTFSESMIDIISDYLRIDPDFDTRTKMKKDFMNLLNQIEENYG